MKRLFNTLGLLLLMLLTAGSVQAQAFKNGYAYDGAQTKMGVPASAVVTEPVLTKQNAPVNRAAGQARVVTFWLNFEAPSSAPYQLGMHELKVDKRQIGYSDLKHMGITHSNMLANQGGVYYDGTFYCCNGQEQFGIFASWIFHFQENNDWRLYAMYDPDDPGFVADMVTLNPVTKKAYGTFVTNDGSYDWDLAEVDYKHLERKTIAKHEHRYVAMAFDRKGRWLGISGLGDLYEINTATGTETYIGSTGLPVSVSDGDGFYYQTGCYDPATDTFYWGRTSLEGKSAIYAVDPQTGKAELYAELPDYTLISFMMVKESYDSADAPAAVTGLKASTVADGTEATVSFTLPQTTVEGGALSGQLHYVISIDGAAMKQDVSSAGASVTETLTVAQGTHRVDVVVSNTAGEGVLAFAPLVVGYDSPRVDGPVNLQAVKTKATLSWPAAVGEVGGHVGEVTYTVTRYPDNKVVAEGLTATSLTDETLPGGKVVKYTYGVTPVNSVGQGPEARSNGQTGGDVLEVPYYRKFHEDVEEQDFSFVDANGDGLTWEVSTFWDFIRFSHKSFLSSSLTQQLSDDWMFLPAITLKAGTRYQLAYDEMGTEGFETSEQMEIMIGQAMTPEAQTQRVADRYVIPKKEPQRRVFTFTVAADGDYYIGFHMAGVTYEPANDIQIQSISVTAAVADAAPAAVDQLVVSAAAQGAYGASLAFTAPTKTNAGGTLSEISDVRIYRNNVLVKVLTGITPGQPVTYTDNTLTATDNGLIQYVVVAENNAGDGEIAVSEVYVGVDKPTVEGITGSVSEKNGKLVFEWTEVSSVGEKEGYVDPATVTYYIYETRGARNYLLGSVTGKTSYEHEFDYNEGEQRAMRFSLGTANQAGYLENATVDLGTHIVGEPYRLPFSESLEGGTSSKLFFWDVNGSSIPLVIATDDSFDEDGGCYQWYGAAMGNTYSVNTGKIRLRGASQPALVFAYKFATTNGSIAVKVQTPDGNVHEEQVFAASAVTPGSWQVGSVELDKYRDEDYVMLKLEMQSDMPSAVVKMDAINVADMPNYNLGVGLSVAPQLGSGAPAEVDIVVRNLGKRDMTDFTVSLYEGNKQVFTQDVEAELSTLQRKVVKANYVPSVFNAGKRVTLRAEVSASRDNTTGDNLYEAEVDILASESPMPEQLQGSAQGAELALSWAAPSDLDAHVTEDFEGDAFTDFSTGGIEQGQKSGVLGNGWTLFDGDGGYDNKIEGVVYAEGEDISRSAWLVFNTLVNTNSQVTPHSGNRFLVSFDVMGGPSYNWLISPLMTGMAQTISFYATEPAGFDKHETLQVLASSTDTSTGSGRNPGYGTTTGSFTVIGEYEVSGNGWEKFTADLPAGTKYFAIRSTSAVATGRFLCVDDVTYQMGTGSVLKYNIYVDGTLVATVDGTATTYSLAQYDGGSVAVTALYDGNRESAPVYLAGTTDIHGVRQTLKGDNRYYNLNGQRVDTPARKGVYITGGRKVIIR